ncbi:hypothetical protein [Methanococcoides sp. LMO-2]|uniref:Membrane protein 6-pyruvoyl-tetrahydropterin synthase-related domain-containing protein n=1 Tax=Methanococcoides cohabitans TaxID=3136559 RepID=A0ABU9KQ73_9EURY
MIKFKKIIAYYNKNKTKHAQLLYILFFISIILLSHQRWFFSLEPITSGDWWYHHTESMKEWFSLPYAWDTQQNIGRFPITGMSFYGFNVLYGFFAILGIPLNISERILFFWPVAIVSVVGMYYLSHKLFNNHLISFFAAMIYSLNTYFLIIQTGHLTVAMSYALAPLIIAFFIDSLKNGSIKYAIITGILLSVSFIYEPRIGYIISLVLFTYILTDLFFWKLTINKIALSFIPFIITLLIHSYWILPYIFGASSNLEYILPSNPWISWMSILDSFTLHHPFWTGKSQIPFVVQPIPLYFFVIPLIAFSSLLIKNKENENIIVFFALIGIIGIFLVKQENAPYGEIYTWLFHNLPGFNMFREASKFYLLIALSYSVLAGYTINELYKKIDYINNKKPALKHAFIIIIFILLIIQAKPAFTNELGQTFDTTTFPPEYINLKDYFHNQDDYFRTIWYPTKQRFGYYSNNHPMINGIEVFFGGGQLSKFMPPNPTWTSLPDNRTFYNLLDILSIKYVVVPFDSENEIYKYYSPKSDFTENMDNFSWLKKTKFSENITVYENDNYMDHFYGIYHCNKTTLENWSSVKNFDEMEKTNIEYEMINPTKYIVKVKTNESFTLVFSEAYDNNWIAIMNGNSIESYPVFSTINGFEISETGNYDLIVEYKSQSLVYIGSITSIFTLIVCISYLLWNRKRLK